jgi:hypothetical protein
MSGRGYPLPRCLSKPRRLGYDHAMQSYAETMPTMAGERTAAGDRTDAGIAMRPVLRAGRPVPGAAPPEEAAR